MTTGISMGNGKAVRSTDKALLVKLDDTGAEHWIPRSQIHDDSEVYEEGHEGDLVVSEWFAGKI